MARVQGYITCTSSCHTKAKNG